MKERSTIHIEAAAAEPPIRAQKEVEAENLMLEFIERAFGDEAEVGNIFFIAAAPNPASASLPTFAVLPGDNGDLFLFQDAVPKSHVTGAKYGPKYAVTRGCFAFNGAVAEAPAVTNCALLAGQCDCFRTVPIHFVECPSGSHSLS